MLSELFLWEMSGTLIIRGGSILRYVFCKMLYMDPEQTSLCTLLLHNNLNLKEPILPQFNGNPMTSLESAIK